MFINIALAEQVPVKVKAEDLRYDDEHKVITASGDVQIIYEDYQIEAQNLVMDTDKNFVIASGNIVVSKDGVESKGTTLYFDLSSKEIQISDFSSDFHTEKVADNIYLHAKELASSGNTKFGYKGGITTCSLNNPHYWMSAEEFHYYPDEKIEGYHVFYNFNFLPMPIFYTPYYRFQLGKRKLILLLPVIGENKVEGFFVKTETMYIIDEETEGSVYIDHLANKGLGRGFLHKYHIDKAPGSFYLYNVNETPLVGTSNNDLSAPITTNYITKFRQKLYLNDYTELNLAHNYAKTYLVPSGKKDATDFDINLKYDDDWQDVYVQHRYNLDYITNVENLYYLTEYNYDETWTKMVLEKNINPIARSRTDTMLWEYRQPLSERWSFKMSPKFKQTRLRDLYPDQRLDVPLTFEYAGLEDDFYKKLTVHYETYLDPDSTRVTTDKNVEYVNKLPMTTLEMQTLDLDLFNVDSSLAAGVLQESKYISAKNWSRNYTTTRFMGDMTFYRDFDVLWTSVLTLKRNVRQYSYDTGDKHYRISDTPSLKTDLWEDHIEHDLSFIYTQGRGNSPIYYQSPQYDHEHRTNESIRFYHEDAFSWRFSGGRNLELDVMDDLITDMDVRPFGKYLHANFNYGWSYQRELWRDFVAAINFKPNREDSWVVKYNFDFNTYEYKSASSLLKFHVGKAWWKKNEWEFWTSRWAFSVEHTYDPLINEINLYTLGIYKDLHCWMAQFNYTKAREEWVLAFSLKAFPDEPFSFISNEDGFSIEAFKRSLEDPGVSRY